MFKGRFDKVALLTEFDSILGEVQASDARPAVRFAPVEKPRRLVHPILYLPIEVKARELASKVVIARAAAACGFRVIMGAIWVLVPWLPQLPPGIVLFKTMNALDASNMQRYIAAGHLTAVLDEEVYGIAPTRSYLSAVTHPTAAALVDLVCAQGASYARSFPYPVPLRVTGTPRAKLYKASTGSDILVCLQSGNINNANRSYAETMAKTLMLGPSLASPEGAEWARILRASIELECDVLPLVDGTIDALARAFPTHQVVVRPHPIEDRAMWAFEQPNVALDQSPTIYDSLQRAGTVVYVSGCTTGLDAYMARLPAVRLGNGGHGISATMHAAATSPEAAVHAVGTAQLWPGDISDHLAELDIAPALLDLHAKNAASGTASINSGVKKAVPLPFHLQKFPDTTAEEIGALVGKAATQLAWNTFLI